MRRGGGRGWRFRSMVAAFSLARRGDRGRHMGRGGVTGRGGGSVRRGAGDRDH